MKNLVATDAVVMEPSPWSIVKMAAHSAMRFRRLAASRSLHLRRDRLGARYTIEQAGTYAIFRETVCKNGTDGHRVVLIVGFRLRALHAHPVPHWVFQRLCILTTPFWSGFPGFRVKLWMVDPTTKNYLGIYDWAGEEGAMTYVTALLRVLRPLSTAGSVWYRIHADRGFDAYLHARKQEQ